MTNAAFLTLLHLAFDLTCATYSGGFTKFGKVLFTSPDSKKFFPKFWIVEVDNSLFVTVRGSCTNDDIETDLDMTEVTNQYGTFHQGFMKSATNIYKSISKITSNYKGTVYFVGHSMGGSVAQVLHVIHHFTCPTLNTYSIAFAPAPSMSLQTSKCVSGRMYSFINSDDIVPSLSIPNGYYTLKMYHPVLRVVEKVVLTAGLKAILSLANHYSKIDKQTYELLMRAVPIIVTEATKYEKGRVNAVRYVPGNVYKLLAEKPKRTLKQCLIDVTETMNKISISKTCIENHDLKYYRMLMYSIVPN